MGILTRTFVWHREALGEGVEGKEWKFPTTFFCCLVAKSCPTLLQHHRLQSARLLCPWDYPGKNTGVCRHFLFQGNFPTQGLNLHLLHCRWTIYHWAPREALQVKVLKGQGTTWQLSDGWISVFRFVMSIDITRRLYSF